MILETKRYLDYAKKMLFRRNKLNFLILFVTSKCNLACGTCFFHKNLNGQNDLSLEEYEKIAQSLDPFSILAISGGEPFLQPELEKICSVFIEKNKVDTLLLPTNGTLTEIILAKTENLLKKFPGVSISINPSLDGMADYHDKNRGASGTFQKCVETIEKLVELKKKYRNLQVIVNSVINRDNISDLKKLMEFLKTYGIDYQAFDLMRGDHRDKNISLPDLKEISSFHEHILKNRHWHLSRKKKVLRNKLLFWIEEVAVLGALKYSQNFKELAMEGKRWPCPCMAGRSISVINPDGSFGACEILPPLANLRNYDYNLSKILGDKSIRDFIKNIKDRKCDCTHICFINSAIASRPSSIFKIFSSYIKARKITKS